MSTFFEKLTGARTLTAPTTSPAEETPAPKLKKAAPIRTAPDAKPSTHLKVAAEEAAPETGGTSLAEEEGELTVDIYDKGDAIVIQSTVAGVKPEDLDVSITTDTVTIRGKRERLEEASEDNYYYKELFWGSFSRSVILPEEIDDEAAEASLKHGLLTIVLPKKRRGIVSKLKVKSL